MADEYDFGLDQGGVDPFAGGQVDTGSIDYYQDFWTVPQGGGLDVGGAYANSFSGTQPTAGVAAGATAGGSWWDSVSKWATSPTGPDKKSPSILQLAMPSLVAGGMAALGELFTGSKAKAAALAKRKVDIDQQSADAATARVAQTSYGSAMPTFKKKTGGLLTYHQTPIQRPQGVV